MPVSYDSVTGSSGPCGAFVCSFIAREGSWFPCALPKGHEDSKHYSGGNCFTHGKYVAKLPWVPPSCPQCGNDIKIAVSEAIPMGEVRISNGGYERGPVVVDSTFVQKIPTAPDTEQDVGHFVVKHLKSLRMPEVANDHEKRIDMGEKKYGQRLRTNNGRDWLLDAYQEALDGISYSAQGVLEGADGEILHRFAILAQQIRDKLTTRK